MTPPTTDITPTDLAGIFAVPPLPRRPDARRSLDLDAAEALAAHIEAGGITRFLYGGNAFLYHATADEFEVLCGWLASFSPSRWAIPGIGPSFGRALDQARVLRRHRFRCAMLLPCGDPRDPQGLETGCREVADAAGMPLVLYLKSEDGFGTDIEAGLDAIARLMDDGIAVAIKYAVVRDDPRDDDYLEGLLHRVERDRVVSGMGERPAIVHLRDFGLEGFTTGSGCVAPAVCTALLGACQASDYDEAERLRALFLPLEDLRDAWGPARVLHHAVELAGIAATGPIPPYVSALPEIQRERLAAVAAVLAGAAA